MSDSLPLVLIVEDDPDDEALARMALKELMLALDLHVARDGREALDFLMGEGAVDGRIVRIPSLVLLDLKLPKVDGLEVLRRLRNGHARRFPPVVILSASSLDADIHRSYELGANSYLRKPWGFADFGATLKQVCSYWLSINIPPP